MSLMNEKLQDILRGSRFLWCVYHLLFADYSAVGEIFRTPIVKKYLGKNLGLTCDLGCGGGQYTKYLARYATEHISIDIVFESLARGKKREGKRKNCFFICADIEFLPFQLHCFDSLVILETLEHVNDDLKGLQEMARILKPGGRLVLSVPTPGSWPGSLSNNKVDPQAHKRDGYKLDDLEYLLAEAGFRLESHTYCILTFSRFVERFMTHFRAKFKIFPPSIILLPCLFDFVLFKNKEKHNPECLVVLASKRGDI